eukprot:TRINITY_DN18324_c0_g1_i2.p1 TRINITY_DN18324_c0_g1~~TRINITY_DN18324_c0_g1_i2.p1  ORF type:complete len:362 (-),score=49.61 TRINITY_DN18324_c0_g1_i2:217-1272(-)
MAIQPVHLESGSVALPLTARVPQLEQHERFLQQAQVTDVQIETLRGRFEKFCMFAEGGYAAKPYLTAKGFAKLNRHYKICKNEDEVHFFRAIAKGTERIEFDDFLLGSAAASPLTDHVLNSYTGQTRARYIFDFYERGGTGFMDFEDLALLVADAQKLSSKEDMQGVQELAITAARDMGEVSIVTLHVRCSDWPLCELRASRHWSAQRVIKKIAHQLDVQPESLTIQDSLEKFVPVDMGIARVSAFISCGRSSCPQAPSVSDGIPGIEKFVHVSFDRFYQVFAAQKLRGTSRLFRFARSVLHTRTGLASSASSSATTTPRGISASLPSLPKDEKKAAPAPGLSLRAAMGGA